MTCYYPLQAFYGPLKSTGRRRIVFKEEEREYGEPFTLPCSRCIGCRLERARQWAVRCMHEASMYDSNCYLTLTYSDDKVPKDGCLDKTHFQKFMKDLREFYRKPPKYVLNRYPNFNFGNGIRFFHCGEYGGETRRPHYHAILFNIDFPDKEFLKMSNGHKLYRSDILDSIWGRGFCNFGDVTFDSANYVARYITDKVTGDDAYLHYLDEKTGIILTPEYTTMSRKPGIGYTWFKKYADDVMIVTGKHN